MPDRLRPLLLAGLALSLLVGCSAAPSPDVDPPEAGPPSAGSTTGGAADETGDLTPVVTPSPQSALTARERATEAADQLSQHCRAPVDDLAHASPSVTAPPTPDLSWLTAPAGPDTQSVLTEAAAGLQRDFGLGLSALALDRTTMTAAAVAPDRPVVSASLSKVPVAMTHLRLLRTSGHPITAEDVELLRRMLVSSDNDAAGVVYSRLGSTEELRTVALQHTQALIGMRHQTGDEPPGLTPTTVSDQLRVLQALRHPPEWLPPQDAQLLLDFMAVSETGVTDSSQTFGVGVLARPAVDREAVGVHLKNGWIDDRLDRTGRWSAGSTGMAHVDGRDLDLALLVEGAPSDECAFSALDAAVEVITGPSGNAQAPGRSDVR